ncbi:MAG: hypothetical protein CL424_04595, partial [Acidimicrobiaceae bacterium]|nr:hypothetical protein [Acidimicrobiaceae bacterium]
MLTTGIVVVVAAAALLADGRVGSESVSNDGGAWLLNRGEGVIGHVNRVVGEVDTTVGPFSGNFDVAQARDVVVVHDRGAGRVAVIDTTQAAIGAVVPVPATIEIAAAPGAVVLHDTATGDVWRFTREEFGAVEALDDESPLVQAGGPSVTAVGRDGDVVVADATASTVWVAPPGAAAEAFELAAVESASPVAVTAATFVGDTAVVAVGDELVTVADGVTSRFELDDEIAVWQQPSHEGAAAEGDAVVGITTSGEVVALDLESGAELSRTPIEGDDPLAPIVHDGCVWTVTMTPSPVFHHCGVASPLPTASTSLALVLVNGWVWVNDVDQGGIWVVDEDELEVQEISDWTAALDLVDSTDEIDDTGGGDEELIEDSSADDLTDEVDELDEDDRNTPPVAEDDDAQTRRGRPIVVRVLDNDTDEDNDPLAVESLSDVDVSGATASGALVSITADGSAVQVTPPEDFLGEISFGYTVHDGRQGRDDAVVRLTVVEPDETTNRPPVPEDDNATVRAGKSVALNVLTNDTDPDGDILVLLSVEGADGAVTYAPDGEMAYAPDVTSEAGTIELAYVVADDYGAEATGTVRIRVRSADSNQPPQARNDVGTTSVGRPVIVDVLANDMDPDGDPLSVQSLASLDDAVTSAQLTSDGRFLFRPETAGTFRFVYTVSDGPEIDQAQIRVDVDDVEENRPPITQLDEVALAIGESRLVRVLDNDGDPDGDIVGIVDWIGAPGLEITEVPGVGFNVMATPSADSRTAFRYWISDGRSDAVRGDVIVSALEREPVDYPPIAVADTVDVRAGRTSELRVLRNDHDPEGKFLRLADPLADLPEGLLRMTPDRQHLLLTVDADRRFGFQFTYDIEDPAGNRSSAVVDVRVVDPNQPNRAPVAGPDVARTPSETPIVIDVEANDYDPDGDPITVESIAEQPEHGTVVLRDDGTVEYTPAAGFSGTDSFVYTLVDGYHAPAGSTLPDDQRGPARDLGQVYIGVMPSEAANRPPVAVDDIGFPAVQIGSDPIVLDVLANDSDPDDDSLRVTEVTTPGAGSARVGANERFVEFTPPADGEPRQLAFGYSIADGRGGTASAQVILELVAEPEPVPPIAVDDTVGPIRARTEIEFDPRTNDLDPDGERDELEIVADSPEMSVLPDGTVVLTAPPETSEIPYRVRDADGLTSEPAFVTVLVAENEAPIVSPINVETPFNEPVVIDVHDAVVDPDSDPLVITVGSQRTGGSGAVVGQPGDSFLQVAFTPDTDFDGTASFDFTVDDRMGHTVAGKATIEVLPPDNRPPEAAPIAIDATAGVPAPVRLPAGVTDPDGPDGHEFRIGEPSNGAVTLDGPSADGTVTIRSAVDAGEATITFDYTVTDDDYTATSTVTVDLSVADFPAPTLTDDAARVLQGEPTPPIDLLANDVDNSPADLRGSGLTVTSVGVTDAGQVEQRGNSVVFTPNPDFFGEASFTYTVQDGRRSAERESTGLVTVQVVGRPAQPQPPVVDTVG